VTSISVSENEESFVQHNKVALHEPIAFSLDKRGTGRFISPVEFEEYARLKAQLKCALSVYELSEETLQAIALSKMDARHEHLNSLIDD